MPPTFSRRLILDESHNSSLGPAAVVSWSRTAQAKGLRDSELRCGLAQRQTVTTAEGWDSWSVTEHQALEEKRQLRRSAVASVPSRLSQGTWRKSTKQRRLVVVAVNLRLAASVWRGRTAMMDVIDAMAPQATGRGRNRRTPRRGLLHCRTRRTRALRRRCGKRGSRRRRGAGCVRPRRCARVVPRLAVRTEFAGSGGRPRPWSGTAGASWPSVLQTPGLWNRGRGSARGFRGEIYGACACFGTVLRTPLDASRDVSYECSSRRRV